MDVQPPEDSRASPPPAAPEVAQALERHLPGLHAFVRMNLGTFLGSQEAVSDVVQSAAREVLLRAEHFEWRGDAAFRSYLCTVATRKMLEKRRYHLSQRRDALRTEPTAGSGLQHLPAPRTHTPSQLAEQIESLERLQQAFDSLEEDERLALTMATILELTTEQIAAELGIALRTAQWRLARARARLAALLSRGDAPTG